MALALPHRVRRMSMATDSIDLQLQPILLAIGAFSLLQLVSLHSS